MNQQGERGRGLGSIFYLERLKSLQSKGRIPTDLIQELLGAHRPNIAQKTLDILRCLSQQYSQHMCVGPAVQYRVLDRV